MGTSGQKIRRFYYTRYRNSEQQIFASQYENIQLKFISQQGFPFTFSQPPLNKNRHRNLPATRANLWACFTCSGQERIYRVGAGWIATAWTGGASRGAKPLWLWVSNRGGTPVGIGYPKGNSVALGRGIQRGRSSTWHTIFRRKV